jgi:endonuclease V-like protein UPF0215 family
MLKEEIRILGFDDGAFCSREGKVPVVGVIFRGGKFLDGVLKTDVEIDGKDSTEKIVKLINNSRHKQQLKVIMTDGITFGGFNILDIQKVYESTGLPVIVVNRKRPNLRKVREALKNFNDFEERWELIKKAGKVKMCEIRPGVRIYYQCVGMEDEEAREVLVLSSTRSQIPEPLRVAHLIATALVKGESSGRA